jgi:hypothetical protein
MKRQTSLKTGQAWNGLYLAAASGGGYGDDHDHYHDE